MLIALTCATRTQSIHLLSVNNVHKLSSEFVIEIEGLLKQSRPGYRNPQIRQSRPGYRNPQIHLKAYPPDRRLCVFTVLKEYLYRTKHLRKDSSKLLISYVKPHKDVSRDTVARWIKTVLHRSGIDTNIYGAHSVRAASTSRAKLKAVPVQEILEKAGWSNERTFSKFYDKKILTDDSFVSAVLQ